jgi:hypothetical protein
MNLRSLALVWIWAAWTVCALPAFAQAQGFAPLPQAMPMPAPIWIEETDAAFEVAEEEPVADWVEPVDLASQDPKLAGYTAPRGIGVEVFAQPGTFQSPLAMAFDRAGTRWVLDGGAKQVAILTKDGQAKPIWTDLTKPTDIAIDDGWLFVCDAGKVHRRLITGPGQLGAVERVGHWKNFRAIVLTVSPEGWLLAGGIEKEPNARPLLMRPNGSTWEWLPSTAGDGLVLAVDSRHERVDGSAFLANSMAGDVDLVLRVRPNSIALVVPSVRLHPESQRPPVMAYYQSDRFPGVFREEAMITGPSSSRVDVVCGSDRLRETNLANQRAWGETDRSQRPSDSRISLLSGPETFVPTQVLTGPDGGIWIVDAGPAGRIFRLRWTGHESLGPAIPLREPTRDLAGVSTNSLTTRLSALDATTRHAAMLELVRRGERDVLLMVLQSHYELPHAQAMALAGTGRLYDGTVEEAFLTIAERTGHPLSALAAEQIGMRHSAGTSTSDVVERFTDILSGYHNWYASQGSHRIHAVITAAGQVAEQLPEEDAGRASLAEALLMGLQMVENRQVQVSSESLYRTLGRLGRPAVDVLVEQARIGQHEDRERLVTTLSAMDHPVVLEMLPELLRQPDLGLTDSQRRRLEIRLEELESRR